MGERTSERNFLRLGTQFLRGNGIYLLASEGGRRMMILFRRAMLSGKLPAAGLTLGPRSYLRGLRCMSVGRNFRAGEGLWLEAVDRYKDHMLQPRIVIGNDVSISRWGHISAINQIEIESGTLIGSHVYIADHHHGTYSGPRQDSPDQPPAFRPLGDGGPVLIGENVWIGNNAVIIGPARIGRGAIIGANAVVTSDIPPGSIAVGVPARTVKQFSPSSGTWE